MAAPRWSSRIGCPPVEHADRILVLDKGRIVEEGNHAELLALGGLYTHLHSLQFEAVS